MSSNNKITKIVVSCPNWVGDVVMSTPALQCIRSNFPHAYVYGIIRSYAYGVIQDGPWFDEIIPCADKTWKGFWALISKIRNIEPDISILLPNSARAAFIMKCAGVENIYGYHVNSRSFFLSGGPQPVKIDNQIVPQPMLNYYLEICRWMQLELLQDPKPELYISDEIQIKGEQLLEKYGIKETDQVVGLNPGAKFGSSKCWPLEYFAQLAELFEEKWNCKILLFVGPGEDEIATSICKKSKAKIINTAFDHVDLATLKPLIKRCQLLITNDTGPRHYAVAFEKPVVVIMGPTDPRYTAANLDKTKVVRKELSCSPCHNKICPYQHECMTSITPEDVFVAAEKLIKEHG